MSLQKSTIKRTLDILSLNIYVQELMVTNADILSHSIWTAANDRQFEGDWVWGEGPALAFVPMNYGWRDEQPNADGNCGELRADGGNLFDRPCSLSDVMLLCQIMKY